MELDNVLRAKLAGLKREHVCKTKVSEDHDEQTSTTITFDYSDVTVGDLLDIVERSETIKAQGRWRRAGTIPTKENVKVGAVVKREGITPYRALVQVFGGDEAKATAFVKKYDNDAAKALEAIKALVEG